MGTETFYRINCDACDAEAETTDVRNCDIKKFDFDFGQSATRPVKPHWSGWLCVKCADKVKAKLKAITTDMGGEHR